jgi:serine/threonine-protein kinase
MLRPGAPGRPGPGRGPGQRRKNSNWTVWGLVGLAVVAVVTLIIGLVVYQQPNQVSVPDLVGIDKPQADLELADSELQAVATPRIDPTCVENQVLAQNPPAHTRVNVGSTVQYEFCAHPGEVTIPLDLVGKTRPEAESALIGLTPTFQDTDSAKPAGTVVRTEPEVGTVLDSGSPVTVFLSKGNFKVVPNLLSPPITQAQAEFLLQRDGFTAAPQVLTVVVNDPAQVGIVNFQSPDPGTEWDPARRITIRVGVAPPQSPPPPSESPSAPPPSDPP